MDTLDIDFLDVAANIHNTYDGNLREYFRMVWNAPNVKLPYHNVRHMFHVTWEAYNGAMYYIKKDPESISRRTLRSGLVGGMVHDYNHLGGRVEDAINIELAIDGLKTFAIPEDKPYIPEISSFVRATQFPHIEGDYPLMARILRDADITYTLSPAWLKTVGYELPAELNKKPEEIIRFQESFLKCLKFSTEWAEEKYRPIIDKRLRQLPILIDYAYGK
jgi:hypothetical protein